MMKAFCSIAIVAMCAALLSVSILMTGCEEADGLESLYITPDSVTLTTSSNTVVFTAAGEALSTNDTGSIDSLALPLEWSVSDSSLGTITRSSGTQAVYKRTSKNGDNTVIVKDQYDNEGYATVKQISEQTDLVLTAGDTTLTGTNTATEITVEGGTMPYTWWVLSEALGDVISAAGDTAVYQAYSSGANSVHVEDANGARGTIAISYEP